MAEPSLLIRGTTVVDVRDGSARADQDVVIEGDRIVSISPKTNTERPSARVVEASGTYLVPGFCDMHAHPLNRKNPAVSLDLMLVHGVTGFRQMYGSAQMLKDRAAGRLMAAGAPRLLALSGPALSPFNAGSAAAALATIREQHEHGADFIKTALVTREVFYEAQNEAGRLGIPIAGHLPNGVDVARASGQGMRSVEHLGPGACILADCSTEQDAIRAAAVARPQVKMPPVRFAFLDSVLDRVIARLVINPVNMARQPDVDILDHAATTFDQNAAALLAERFVRDGTWQVPTLIRSRTNYMCDDPAFGADPDLRYISAPTLRGWTKAAEKFARFPAASRQTFRLVYATMLRLTKLLDDAGVKMLAGSDACGAAWEVPGAALHQEFDELARAGLSPLRILQMTTWNAAEFLGATDVMGSVSAGKHADLVLLDADPVESADHLHRVAGVVRGGRYYARTDLDRIKDTIAAARSVQ